MAEEPEIPEAGESNTGVDPTATAIALAGASREDTEHVSQEAGSTD